MYDLAIELKKSHNISIITTSEEMNDNYKFYNYEGLNILKIKTGKINSSKSYLKRGINEFLISYNILKYGNQYFNDHECDLIIWYSPLFFWKGY